MCRLAVVLALLLLAAAAHAPVAAAQSAIEVCSVDGTRSDAPLTTAAQYTHFRSALLEPKNFGPFGTVNQSVTLRTAVSTISSATLSGCEVFFVSGLSSVPNASELSAVNAAVRAGMVLVADGDTGPATAVSGVDAILSTLDGSRLTTTTSCPGTSTGGTVTTATNPATNGPFGDLRNGTFGTTLSSVVQPAAGDHTVVRCGDFAVRMVIPPGKLVAGSGLVLSGGDPSAFDVFTEPTAPAFNPNNEKLYLNTVAAAADTSPPDTTITSGPSGPTNDSTPTFSFTSTEARSTFQCRVDTAAFAPCSPPFTTATLADGAHTFGVRAIDAAGNIDGTPAQRSFTVDTGAPAAPSFSGTTPSSPANDNSPEIRGTAEAGTTVSLYTTASCLVPAAASGTAAVFASPGITVSVADNSTTTFYAKASDAAGNSSPCSLTSISYVEDSLPPDTTIGSGPAGPTNDSTPTFGFSSSEQSGATFDCRVYLQGATPGSFASCTSPHTTATLVDGTYTFEVRARDAAGNLDATPAQRSFTVDTGAPSTTIDSGPAGPTNDSTPTFGFSSDSGAGFDCRVYLEGQTPGSFASCTSPHTTATLVDGSYTFEVRARNAAGNVDPTPAQRSFTVDTAPPDTTITSGPTATTADATPTFSFSATEAGTSFECRLFQAEPSGPFAPCSSPHTTAFLDDGAYSFEVRATDAAGNLDQSPALRAFTVQVPSQQLPPALDTAIESGPSGLIRERSPSFGFSSSQPQTTFECSLDGSPFAPCTSPFSSPELRAGPHLFRVRARDARGNVDETPAQIAFTIAAELADLPPPRLGKSFNVEPIGGGEVLISEPPSSARARASLTVPGIKGRNFVPLREARQIAVGSLLHTRRGTVRLLSARDGRGRTQTGEFSAGVFQVLQSRRRRAGGLTELRLKGSRFGSCRSGRRSQRAQTSRSRRRIRRLRGNARGRFSTRGRHSSATVRGTIWEVTDRCDGTLTKVTRGKVAVRDFRRRKTVLVRLGKSYLARAPR